MITFTRTTQTYSPATDTLTAATTTITGEAIETPRRSAADLSRLNELNLRSTETILLIFTPTTYGQLPRPGDVVTWPNDDTTGVVYTVRDVNALRPDGVTILARIACSR
jgi:hypothetical protein